MKIWVLTITEDDFEGCYLYKTREGAIKTVQMDLEDRYHFDTTEPYISKDELEEKKRRANRDLLTKGNWQDEDATYWLDHKEVNE